MVYDCLRSYIKRIPIQPARSVFFQKLASASDVTVGASFDLPGAVKVVTADAVVSLPLAELVDFEAEIARLSKELETAKKDEDFFLSKLNNENFVAKAPAQVVENQRTQLAKVQEKIKMLKDSIDDIKSKM